MLTKMIKMHGVKNGLKRFVEECIENRLFDVLHGVETAKIVTAQNFYELINQSPEEGGNWYQPTYATPLVKAFKHLTTQHITLNDKSPILFVDLGVGKGKPCVIANRYLKGCKNVGIDLSEKLLEICRSNLEKCGAAFELIQENVLNIDYSNIFNDFDQIVIHNKNAFDKSITAGSLKAILYHKSNKKIFYVYNNPIYKDLFKNKPLLFQHDGWHKNHRLHIYEL